MLLRKLLIVALLAAVCDYARAADFDVKDFGAKGDGKSLDSPAINKAVDTAAAAGGGTVRVGAGTYLCASIRLKSNICLHLDQGATILAASPKDGWKYDPPEPNEADEYQDFGHSHWHNSLIWGENLENVSIMGPGLIYGKGLVRSGGESRSREQNELLRNAPTSAPDRPFGYPSTRDSVESGWGNKAVALKLCRNVILRDISILHGGHFAILATGVDNFTVDNVKIDTNRDGMDIDCCRNVRISNCSVNSPFDDGICLKSSLALGTERACENVTITNCQVSGYDEGTFLDGTFKREYTKYSQGTPTGRIKCGTESNGGFKNIAISNCVFVYCRGLALETVDGGPLEDVSVTNIVMRDVVNSPIFLRLGARLRGPKDSTAIGALRRVSISNVVAYNADTKYGSIISGIPDHDIENVKLSNIRVWCRGGGTKEQAATQPAEKEKSYPEPAMFGDTAAYGFYIRHVRDIELSDVDLKLMSDDLRPAIVLDGVNGVHFLNVFAPHSQSAPTLSVRSAGVLRIDRCSGLTDLIKEHVDHEQF